MDFGVVVAVVLVVVVSVVADEVVAVEVVLIAVVLVAGSGVGIKSICRSRVLMPCLSTRKAS